MTPSLNIRFSEDEDFPSLAALATQTFIATYGHELPLDGIQTYCDQHFQPQVLARSVVQNEAYYLLGEQGDQKLIGYAKLDMTEQPKVLAGKKHLQVEKIYFLQTQQRSGYGYQLMSFIREFAQSQNYETLWVKVWEQNEVALKFYKKLGFESVGTISFDFVG